MQTQRSLNPSYLAALRERLTPEQLIEDISRRRAYATDASFYQLTPLLIVHLDSLEEVQDVCQHQDTPARERLDSLRC